mgnify:FL=1
MSALDAEYAPTISIHAPREGGDVDLRVAQCVLVISIHAPREGGDSHSSSFRSG